ncbi:Acylphosphatase-like domain-containing protein [Syncephalis plumigaleata]|nr:Acylphosphatase-like domain-containing protein [Syncephalis plumigaleata]
MGSFRELRFEVFGRVQGVFFRRYTVEQARTLGLVGWVRNTPRDTVEGVAQGTADNIDIMKRWLEKTGSPSSQIVKTEMTESEIDTCSFSGFDVRRHTDD